MFSWLLISSIFFIGSFIFITVKLVRLQRASIKDERLELLRPVECFYSNYKGFANQWKRLYYYIRYVKLIVVPLYTNKAVQSSLTDHSDKQRIN